MTSHAILLIVPPVIVVGQIKKANPAIMPLCENVSCHSTEKQVSRNITLTSRKSRHLFTLFKPFLENT